MTTYNSSIGDMDIIFAGGGTAACVAAGRLAKANPDLKILLIEGGRNNFEDPTIVNPAVYLTHLAPDSTSTLFYKAKPTKYTNDRESTVQMGGILGGGSSINFMMYTRAQGIDFDNWNTVGWTAEDMLPVLRKLETFHEEKFHRDEPGIDKSKHGYEGPIHISSGGHRGKAENEIMKTVKEMGYNETVDLQDLKSTGFSRYQRYVSPEGKRQDAAHCHVHPLLQNGSAPNLHLLVESKVIRVIFDESSPPRAIGVEYKPNEIHALATSLSKPVHHIVKAKKLVVVAAGALGTPQILERSGVGAVEVLEKLDIPVISDLPGVGENYQDHHLLLYPYKTSLGPGETLDPILQGRKSFVEALENKDPYLGYNGLDVGGKLRMTDEEAQALGPEFEKHWEHDFAPYPTRPVMLCGFINAFLGDPSLVDPGQYVTMGMYTAYPYSRGNIHITSKDDVLTGYTFDHGFLSHPADIKKQLWAYKMQREIFRRLPFYAGELSLGHPPFPASSSAALHDYSSKSESPAPAPKPTSDLTYTAEDDALIEDWIRGNVQTTWHSLGTCAMKPRDQQGVVDADLNVYGTQGLKVGDLSIAPGNVAANTNNTALAVGEKVAIIIGKEIGVKV